MAELKPRLIITNRGRKRRGFGTFLIVLVIFGLGFYAGSKYGDYVFGTGAPLSSIKGADTVATEPSHEASVKDEPSAQDNMGSQSSAGQGLEDQKSLIDAGFKEEAHFESPGAIGNTGLNQGLTLGSGGASTEEVSYSSDQDPPGEQPKESIEEAPGPANTYTLQVGAFATTEEAKDVADGYIAKGYQAYVVPIENSRGESWNLIKIGKFDTIDQAWSYAAYFKNREGQEAFVETLEQQTVFNESWDNAGQSEPQ